MKEDYEFGASLSSLNLTSALANFRQQVGESDLALLRTTLCQEQLANQHQTTTNLIDQTKQLPLTQLLYKQFYDPTKAADNYLDYYFTDFWHKNGDPRSSNLPFMSAGPWKLVYATLIYLYLIKWLLPNTMRHRKAFELNWCIRLYNLLMVLSNLYAFYHGSRILQFGWKCFGCEIFDQSNRSPEVMELLHYGWLFLISRLVEWLDTIFFVLRKKERQVSKLHVFHHSFVPMFCWFYLKFLPGYTVAFFPYVNSLIHTIMYTYYFLATFGPKLQPYLWWKRYLTSLQIVQFVLILIQLATIPLSMNERCQYPRGFLLGAFGGAILFLWLFYTYYMDTYRAGNIKSNSSQQREQQQQQEKFITKKDDKTGGFREGSSKSLSDSIDNALFGGKLEENMMIQRKHVNFAQ